MLRYIVGDDTYYRAILHYFDEWKFKHPTPNDLLRIMELESDMELDWFFEHWVNTLHRIDYSVKYEDVEGKAILTLKNESDFPMPIDVEIKLKNGETVSLYIPLRQMRGSKPTSSKELASWIWVAPEYRIDLEFPIIEIESVIIDPKMMLADVNRDNNVFPRIPKPEEEAPKSKKKKGKKNKKSKSKKNK
jgi:aminopeptidase N